jgi:hypothetical protein
MYGRNSPVSEEFTASIFRFKELAKQVLCFPPVSGKAYSLFVKMVAVHSFGRVFPHGTLLHLKNGYGTPNIILTYETKKLYHK